LLFFFVVELKKQNLEKFLVQYQNQIKKKLNMQNEAPKSGNNKINLLNLKEVVSVINGIQKEEMLKIKFVLTSKKDCSNR
jgi:hypothetical protein